MAEAENGWPRYRRLPEKGGHGCGRKWAAGWHGTSASQRRGNTAFRKAMSNSKEPNAGSMANCLVALAFLIRIHSVVALACYLLQP